MSARAFLDGANIGALGLIAGVTAVLARASLHDPVTVGLAVLALPILISRPLSSPVLIVAGAVVGVIAGR